MSFFCLFFFSAFAISLRKGRGATSFALCRSLAQLAIEEGSVFVFFAFAIASRSLAIAFAFSLSKIDRQKNHPTHPQVHLRRRRRGSTVDRRRRVGLLRQFEKRPSRLSLRLGLAGGVREQAQEHIEPPAVHKDGPQVGVLRHEPRQRSGNPLTGGPVPAAHRVEHGGEHRGPRRLVLEPLEGLLDAVLGGLHQELAVE